MKAKLPINPKEKDMIRMEKFNVSLSALSNADGLDVVAYVMYDKCQKDMLQFFIDFLDEHIELAKERHWNSIGLVALKINFKSRFMENKK
jgi:hypothetical protein